MTEQGPGGDSRVPGADPGVAALAQGRWRGLGLRLGLRPYLGLKAEAARAQVVWPGWARGGQVTAPFILGISGQGGIAHA